MTPDEWLTREDIVCHPDRLARLKWLSDIAPKAEYWTFPGGLLAKYLIEEARYCFVYGQFLATTVLGIAYIERTVAALFFATGRNDLERAGLTQLLKEALNYGWVDQREYANLQHARQIRNPITHFRKPGDAETIEYRSVIGDELPYSVIEEDARHVIETALRFLEKNVA